MSVSHVKPHNPPTGIPGMTPPDQTSTGPFGIPGVTPSYSASKSAAYIAANTHPAKTADVKPHTWTPLNENTVKAYIQQAAAHSGGNVEKAFEYLRDQRWNPKNFYNSNLSIAADYYRARWDTQQFGPEAETKFVTAYLAAKMAGVAPKEGPGPVSPYSALEAKYMYKGIEDQAQQNGVVKNVVLGTPILPIVPGLPPVISIGDVKGAYEDGKGFVENSLKGVAHFFGL